MVNNNKKAPSFNITKLLERQQISNELNYQRALIADRQLKLLSKDDPSMKAMRNQLRTLIVQYENKVWNKVDNITTTQIQESDTLEQLAERERMFIQHRKEAIRKKLKQHRLTQEDLATLLGHKSKTHMSELMNGLVPFTLRDLIIIHHTLHIKINTLVPTFLSPTDRNQVAQALRRLNKPGLALSERL